MSSSPAPHPLYDVFAHELARALRGRELDATDRLLARRLPELGTAVQIAVGMRLSGRDSHTEPMETMAELVRAAEAVRRANGSLSLPFSAAELEYFLSLPVFEQDALGPIPAATVRATCVGARDMRMVAPTVLYPAFRTIDMGEVRREQARSEGAAAFTEVVSFVGASPENLGTGVVLTSHHGMAACGSDSACDLDPVRLRVSRLRAVLAELRSLTREAPLVLFRNERRFEQGSDGTVTADRLWSVTGQQGWAATVDAGFPDAAVLVEAPREWVRDAAYSVDGGRRRLGTLDQFFADIERRPRAVHAWDLLMTDLREEASLSEPDTITVLDGTLETRSGERFVAAVVTAEAESTLYVASRDRAEAFTDAHWDAIRRGLAALHGSASAGSSTDQGAAIRDTFKRALKVSSPDLNVASNLDVLRAFAHAVETSRHWRGGDEGPGAGLREVA